MTGRQAWPSDAAEIARVLAASGRPWAWFDGAAAAPGEPRVSYLGVAAGLRIAESGLEREFLAGLRAAPGGVMAPGLESGWAVALSYEFGLALLGLDPISGIAADPAPPALALRLDGVLAIDHERGTVEARGDTAQLAALLDSCASSDRAVHACAGEHAGAWRRSDAEYAAEVEACRSAIRDGDAYVLCLTDTAQASGDFDPLDLYLRLRESGGAVRGGVIVAGERALVSASPERFLSVRGQRIFTHPIKGTRPRGTTPKTDNALAAQLANDPKERAENLMIVDLMRNDLSRVCATGTVAVEGFLRVETHPHVHQLVSTISGELRAGHDIFDAIAACFPGGSMTGAPKRRAVEILRALEGGPRGLYSGCFGWIADSGDAELAMTIRSIELRGSAGKGVALVGAGGGVTADSDPHRETAEKHLKAAPVLAALASCATA
ncbi:anthranilate synthase component I family protein [Leucobacter sp. VD1]|uniref:anthranilate synthase component I family protein n=1 Tax=Leucobacter sp. VD1 TaxID=3080381 RepID=UPI003018665A